MKPWFLQHLKAECLKYKRVKIIWLVLLSAVTTPLLTFFVIRENQKNFVPLFKRAPWELLLMMNWHDAAITIVPVFIMLLIAWVMHIEFRGHTFRQLFIQPRSYANIYFSKFLVIQMVIISFFCCFSIAILLEGWVLSKVRLVETFTFQDIPWRSLVTMGTRIYLAIMAITAIQYWMSMRFRTFIVPVISGLLFLLTAPALASFGLSLYDPYMYPRLFFSMDIKGYEHTFSLSTLVLVATATLLLFVVVGLFDLRRLKTKE